MRYFIRETSIIILTALTVVSIAKANDDKKHHHKSPFKTLTKAVSHPIVIAAKVVSHSEQHIQHEIPKVIDPEKLKKDTKWIKDVKDEAQKKIDQLNEISKKIASVIDKSKLGEAGKDVAHAAEDIAHVIADYDDVGKLLTDPTITQELVNAHLLHAKSDLDHAKADNNFVSNAYKGTEVIAMIAIL